MPASIRWSPHEALPEMTGVEIFPGSRRVAWLVVAGDDLGDDLLEEGSHLSLGCGV